MRCPFFIGKNSWKRNEDWYLTKLAQTQNHDEVQVCMSHEMVAIRIYKRKESLSWKHWHSSMTYAPLDIKVVWKMSNFSKIILKKNLSFSYIGSNFENELKNIFRWDKVIFQKVLLENNLLKISHIFKKAFC